MKNLCFLICLFILSVIYQSCGNHAPAELNQEQLADTVLHFVKMMEDTHLKKLPESDEINKKIRSKLAWELADKYSSRDDSLAYDFASRIKKSSPADIYYDALSNELFGRFFFERWETDSAEQYLTKAHSAYKIMGDTAGLARVVFVRSLCSEQKEQFADAFLDLTTAISYLDHLNDSISMAEASVELAFILIRVGEIEKGKELLFKVKEFGERNTDFNGNMGVNKLLSEAYFHEKNYEKSKEYSFRALELASDSANKDELSYIYNQIGISYMAEKKYEKAIEFLNKTWEAKNNGQINDAAIVLFNIGKVYYLAGKPDTAISILRKSLELSREHPYMLRNKELVHSLLSDIYKEQNQYANALKEFELYHVYKDSLSQIQNKELILKTRLEHENAEKTAKIQALSKEKELDKAINRIVLLLGLLTLAIAIFSILQMRKVTFKQNEIAKTRLELAMKELQTNQKLLAEFRDRLIERNNEAISKIEDTPFKEIENQDIAFTHQEQMLGLEHLRLLTQEDWIKFTELIDEAYPGLRKQIEAKFPSLTAGEERVLLLVCLKTENKDIAAILGISPDSVRKSKYRLKQKLNLSSEENLEEFIYTQIK